MARDPKEWFATPAISRALEGWRLRWSLADEALVLEGDPQSGESDVLAFTPALAAYLEGWASVSDLPEFSRVLWPWLLVRNELMEQQRKQLANHLQGDPEAQEALREDNPGWSARRRFASLYQSIQPRPRSFGVAAAHIFGASAGARGTPQLASLLHTLSDADAFADLAEHDQVPDVSQHANAELRWRLIQAHFELLGKHAPESIAAWMRDAAEAADSPAETAEGKLDAPNAPPPKSLGEALDQSFERPRLQGAKAYAEQLSGWLSVPDSHADQDEGEPSGFEGFAQRGDLSLLTPSAHAVDELEFLRRFSEGELSYFQRERLVTAEPAPLVILLDLSARVWGQPRLILIAALRVIVAAAERKGREVRLAATSSDELHAIDPRSLEGLHKLLELPSLAPHPAAWLDQIATRKELAGTQCVLLSHPRSLEEPRVRSALREVSLAGASLAAVTCNAKGAMARGRVRQGVLHPEALFDAGLQHIDPGRASSAAKRDHSEVWRGDVRKFAQPFQLDLPGMGCASCLDRAGEWWMVCGHQGVLTLTNLAKNEREYPPLPVLPGVDEPPRVEQLIPVEDGIVLLGEIQGREVIALYQLPPVRRVTLRVLPGTRDEDLAQRVGYDAANHTLSIGPRHLGGRFAQAMAHVLGQESDMVQATAKRRTQDAGDHALNPGISPENQAFLHINMEDFSCQWGDASLPPAVDASLPIIVKRASTVSDQPQTKQPTLLVDPYVGECLVQHLDRADDAPASRIGGVVRPLDQGVPLLKGARLNQALLRGSTLAISLDRAGEGAHVVIANPVSGKVQRMQPMERVPSRLLLSARGEVLAEEHRDDEAHSEWKQLNESDSSHLALRSWQPRKFSLEVGRAWLMVTNEDGETHFLTWHGSALTNAYSAAAKAPSFWLKQAGLAGAALESASSTPAMPPQALGMSAGFVQASVQSPGGLWMVADHWNSVWIFSPQARLIGALHFRGKRMAAWMPDGTRYGPRSITGGPATRFALVRFAEVLQQAAQR